jgi:hypothetical protein
MKKLLCDISRISKENGTPLYIEGTSFGNFCIISILTVHHYLSGSKVSSFLLQFPFSVSIDLNS